MQVFEPAEHLGARISEGSTVVPDPDMVYLVVELVQEARRHINVLFREEGDGDDCDDHWYEAMVRFSPSSSGRKSSWDQPKGSSVLGSPKTMECSASPGRMGTCSM